MTIYLYYCNSLLSTPQTIWFYCFSPLFHLQTVAVILLKDKADYMMSIPLIFQCLSDMPRIRFKITIMLPKSTQDLDSGNLSDLISYISLSLFTAFLQHFLWWFFFYNPKPFPSKVYYTLLGILVSQILARPTLSLLSLMRN